MNDNYKQYDEIVGALMTNAIVEKERGGKYLLYDFHAENEMERLYFNVVALAADMNMAKFYVDAPLLTYLKLKLTRGRKQKNMRWLNPIQKSRLDDQFKTSAYIIADFVRESFNVDEELFKEINDTYYGWGEKR